jgi:type I restriction enzyme S subunit
MSAIGKVCEVSPGKTPAKTAYTSSGDIKIIKFRDVLESGEADFCKDEDGWFDSKYADEVDLIDLKPGTILLTNAAHSVEHIGKKVAYVRDLPDIAWSVCFVGELTSIRSKDESGFSTKWVYYWLQTNDAKIAIARAVEGAHLVPRQFKRIEIPNCSSSEQVKHLTILALTDDAISKAREELEVSFEVKRSLLNNLLQRGLPGRHAKFAESKKITYPSSWTPTKLSKCGVWSAGGTPDRETVSYYEGAIPWVKSGEVNYCTITETEDHLSEEGAKQTTCGVLPIGTLLIAMYGAGVTRGRVATLGVEASTNQAVASFNGHEGISNEFIYYWFEFNYQRVRAWAAGSNQDNLSGYLLKSLPIAIPEHEEQLKIVELLKASDNAIQAIEKKISSLITIKKSLLQNLLTGKLRIPPTIGIPS